MAEALTSRKEVLMLGLNGSGKTRVCEVLRTAGESSSHFLAATRPVILDGNPNECVLCTRVPVNRSLLADVNKVIELVDCSGATDDRILWPMMYSESESDARCRQLAAQPLTTERTPCKGWLPPIDGVCFVINAHDVLRMSLAWSEFTQVLRDLHDHFKPVLVVVLRHTSSASLTAAQLLKTVEDHVLPPNVSPHWDIVDVDMCSEAPLSSLRNDVLRWFEGRL